MRSWRNHRFRRGDVLFTSLGDDPLHRAIEDVTSAQWGSDKSFSHVGVVAGTDPLEILEARAAASQVSREAFFRDSSGSPLGNHRWSLGRFRISPQDREAWILDMYGKVGQAYADHFTSVEGETYCADFIARSLNKVLGEEVVSYRPMFFGEAGSKIKRFWISYFQDLDLPIPEGKPGVSPLSIWNSALLERLF